ncbi:MAG: hypothetical protein AABZ53_03290 [Planctomycetota bacterium]
MKKFWSVLSFMAIVNLLAILGFVGWLSSTQRLNMDRVRAVRGVLAPTLADEVARLADEEAKDQEAKKAVDEATKAARPPMTAQEKVAVRLDATELDTQRYKRLQADIEAMQASLRAQQDKLVADRRAFDEERAAFARARSEVEDKVKDEQFKKTLAVVEAMDAKTAVLTLKQMMGATDDPNGGTKIADTGPGIAYLNAMSAGKRNELLSVLAKTDAGLAAKLLDGLRSFGQSARASEVPPK